MSPSSLGFNQPRTARAVRELAEENSRITPVRGQAPWQGFVPDIDVAHLGISAARDIEGLVARGDETGLGEILGKFPGFDHVDSTYAATSSGTELGEGSGNTNHITGLFFFARHTAAGAQTGEFNDMTIAVTAGTDGTAGSAKVYRTVPSTGVWEEIEVGDDTGSSVAMVGSYPGQVAASTAQLCSFAVFPGTALPRTGLTTMQAGEPSLIWTNNHDAVKIYAVPTGGVPEYEDLTEAFGTGTAGFRCRSLASWGDRMNYFNTVESGTRFRQRLRRSAIGNPDPNTSNDGSGAIDFQDFQGEGLRVEPMGNALACYFEDGVSFVRRTFQSVSPYYVQNITTKRGLLSTHSLVNLGGGVHFGIFTDGWYFINENGDFKEVGLANIDGVETPKWRDTFFRRLDMDERDRIDVHYDSSEKQILITIPLDGAAENQEVWVYDIHGDRVFTRQIPVTKFGTSDLQTSSALTIGAAGSATSIGGLGDLTIGELEGTIGSWGATFGRDSMIHGTHSGLVLKHDPDLATVIDVNSGSAVDETWKYTTVLTGFGSSRYMKAVREIVMEFVRVMSGSFQVKLFGNAADRSETQTYTVGDADGVQTLFRGFRYSNTQISMEISGTVPVNFRSFDIDIRETQSRLRAVS